MHPDLLEEGWAFDDSYPGATKESLYGFKFLRELYQKSDPKVTTSVTVPVLWDKQTETIVNNESSQVIRIFNSAFNELTGNNENYYPDDLQEEIDKLNGWIYNSVNNGVYKSGFAKTQESYDEAVTDLFEALDKLDQRLTNSKYLIEDTLTFRNSSSLSHLIEWIEAIISMTENPFGIGLAMSGNAGGVDQTLKVGGEWWRLSEPLGEIYRQSPHRILQEERRPFNRD